GAVADKDPAKGAHSVLRLGRRGFHTAIGAVSICRRGGTGKEEYATGFGLDEGSRRVPAPGPPQRPDHARGSRARGRPGWFEWFITVFLLCASRRGRACGTRSRTRPCTRERFAATNPARKGSL